MHSLYTSLLIAFANNIDNISTRIAYSIRGIHIPNIVNLWISAITFFVSASAAYFGSSVILFVSPRLCVFLSMILLICIGLITIFEPLINKDSKNKGSDDNVILSILKEPEKADINKSKDIDFKEATLLGIALSINNIGGSFSAGVLGLNAMAIGFLSAVFSFIALWAGNIITAYFSKTNPGRKANIFAGILLILIAVKQIL